MEIVNLEERLAKFDKFKNIENFNIIGGNGKISLLFKSKGVLGQIIYDSADTFKVVDYTVTDDKYFPLLLILAETIAYESDKEIFFNNLEKDSVKVEKIFKKLNYVDDNIDGDVGYYLDLTSYDSFTDRIEDLSKSEEFKKYIK